MKGAVIWVIIALLVGGFIGFSVGKTQGRNIEKTQKEQTALENKNKAVVEKFAQEFKNKGNYDIVDETFAADAKLHVPLPIPQNPEGLKMAGQAIGTAFPDVHVTIDQLFAKGDKVVERTTATGTHKGTFSGVPATNKQVTWTENHIYQVKGGKIVELWSEINILGILSQIGAFPPPAQESQ